MDRDSMAETKGCTKAAYMDVSNNWTFQTTLSGYLFTAALSSLDAANKQPQLALDLIVKSFAGLQAAGTAQSSPAEVVEVAPQV
jgi:hypothetical protein